jgi:uncharacterized protein (TIGR02145 family)
MNKQFLILLFFAIAAYGQQTSVAVLPSEGAALGNEELEALTDEMRGVALKVLPTNIFSLLPQNAVVKRLGGAESYIKECSESSCIVNLGKKAQVDYVAQASVSKLGEKIRLRVELYRVNPEGLVGIFNDNNAENISDLLAIVEKRAPAEVFGKIPGASGGSRAVSPSVAGGISGLESAGGSYEANYDKSYLANINTEPQGAILVFNGEPVASCGKTPCKAELPEGDIRIVAALEQYERMDTTVSIRQNNQSINIRLKANFGVLEIKPAYSDGIGSDRGWSLTINGKEQSSYENRLSPGNYEVKLSHECYEDISFKAGINKGSREVFDMARHLGLKTGGLVLSAEQEGEPASEPVFVNGKQAGETPFSGTVPVCAEIGIGSGKSRVDVKVAYKQTVRHKYKIDGVLTDSRDGKKYKIVKIGWQNWMAENLNYNANGSKCYGNQDGNCAKYGRLYNWATAKTACPKGWHLPSDAEWTVLTDFVGGSNVAGTKLKSASGWNTGSGYKPGTDEFGFSALPGGNGNSSGSFYDVGGYGTWWSAAEGNAADAWGRNMNHGYAGVGRNYFGKSRFFSVRCAQDLSGGDSFTNSSNGKKASQVPALETKGEYEKQSEFDARKAKWEKEFGGKTMHDSDAFCEEQRRIATANFAESRKYKGKKVALLTEAIAALDKCLAKTPSPDMKKKVELNKEILEKERSL